MKPRLLACATALAGTLVSAWAAADRMDPSVERLVVNREECLGEDGQSATGARCVRDDAAFKRLINQYGFAVAPSAMHSARTTGFGGFHLSIEGQYSKIDDGAEYLELGTRGRSDGSTNEASLSNDSPDPILQLYSLKVRKSFGFGLEITGAIGFVPQTELAVGGADVRLSLLEGFRAPDWPGFLPDVAFGGGVRTITGTNAFQLTVASLDTQLSKPFAIASSSIITPWIGYQYLWIFGDSGLVDMTPGTDPIGYCNYAGDNVPGNPDPNKTTTEGEFLYDGQPNCLGGSREDFNNNTVFDAARFERQRLIFGVSYRFEMVSLGLEFLTDIIPPADAQVGGGETTIHDSTGAEIDEVSDSELLADEKSQWAFIVELGATF
ncbi:MAG: hypothetical protein JW751_14715 [Polyangiaceae bacterium]|nr:hypothetical protein [Polyangiaceae bacterium]